jgi:hypothetical protein
VDPSIGSFQDALQRVGTGLELDRQGLGLGVRSELGDLAQSLTGGVEDLQLVVFGAGVLRGEPDLGPLDAVRALERVVDQRVVGLGVRLRLLERGLGGFTG